ncbi:MAG: GatB/YqeY domain-containing protein [Candidatus Liptonbacteria bacterium]|nr:GatB/YqeY domain-containing protein [Candidatus Liptonbacteria bacterium]
MTLKDKISEDIKAAMKSGAEGVVKLSTLRMVSAAVSNKAIELRKKDMGLSDLEILDVISSELKKRKDAAEEFRKGGREDLAKKEESELLVLKEYLPPEISDEDLIRIVRDGVRESGASGEKDFGKAMKVIMPTLKGKASGDRVSAALKNELQKNG